MATDADRSTTKFTGTSAGAYEAEAPKFTVPMKGVPAPNWRPYARERQPYQVLGTAPGEGACRMAR